MSAIDINHLLSPANIRFSEAFDNYLSQWGIIWQFRHLAEVGFPKLDEHYTNYIIKFLETMRPGKENAKLLVDPVSFFEGNIYEVFAKESTRKVIQNALAVVDSVSLVFGHSLLDALLNEFLGIACEVDPTTLLEHIKEKKIKLSEVIDSTKDEIIATRIKEKLQALERESLPKKTDILFMICQPGNHTPKMGSYVFDRLRLKDIDEKRHGIIHSPQVAASLQEADDTLWYLQKTGMHFLVMMNHKYGLKIISDPQLRKPLQRDE